MDNGCELVDVEVAQDRGRGILRITVDSQAGDGRVPIERCVVISREVETQLDGAEAMPGAYQLEVSSPGLDRVLGREKDFTAVIGQEVKLRTRRPIEGRKRFRGRLISLKSSSDLGMEKGTEKGMDESDSDNPESSQSGIATKAIVEVNVDGVVAVIPFEEIEKANAIYEFSSADFAKKPKP